ncbi:MAG: translation elongation factor Ts [Chlamydiae bacterium RIFCSPHIGHO2_12_FULL_44_59]|nr:MAG: translation elongation factor Ts [Chlamydiae bacterium RIFCSPHIGHO2_01_FULL_44_39]OGN59345.1 MAG: translation elongation factor Ts [Chlamydiae bacterium RIFCSPHIGHO2_02_FULL_45_9]OGN60475.1 MAG: translation elongation factor Ts [Chlamydiae bacterium RIFCSPHIGHO2_12_FULL_44_59]OGN66596.1 MAG: translation elongation factor Ts [Chlamydiae bacterium RIFCSPLOWO2_01_FULL_44_52]OGN69845.1 MAG: translation elongation factor Ts [Chlamydiae bacterium RIFCSPLOWO2_02_FULL_45_22]OGN70385.1 MAG: tra
MKEITADMIKELRERTGVGMGKCKEALVLAEGDIEKAIDVLRKAGMASAAKKEGRETKEGLIVTAEDKQRLVLIEANAETDFVVQNDRFKHFVHDCIKQALEGQVGSLEGLMKMPYYKDKTITLDQYRNLVIQALGENIQIRRIETITKHPNSSYGIYSHMGGKLLVVVEVEGAHGEDAIAKEVAMHVAAENPDYVTAEEVPPTVIAREEEIARSQVKDKPSNIVDKIVAGKVKAYIDQFCLLHQKYIKDSSVTVAQFVEICGKKIGKVLKVKCFWRWKVGQ